MRNSQYIQIDITNKCPIGDCVYCSRFERHIRPDMKYEMSLDFLSNCLESLRKFPGPIGIIGGEPQLHTQFTEVCALIRSKHPREKMALWTSINPLGTYSRDISATFGFIAFNQHSAHQLMVCRHQPLTLASCDMVKDEGLRTRLIDDCWIGNNWCPSITKLGAYFCEVAGGLAYLQGIRGWSVGLEPGWWERERKDYGYQLDLCQLCGGPVPMERQLICNKRQKISSSFMKMLWDNNLILGDHELVEMPFTKAEMAEAALTWRPGAYREDKAVTEGLGSTLDWREL
jgi:hypothetical protein